MKKVFAKIEEFYLQNKILYSNPSVKSYSQFGEDTQILRMINASTEFYLDIGSGHPIIGNNTYGLYRKKWSGILIEPIPELAKLTKKVRPRDKVINAAVGVKTGELIFYKFHPYQYSTTDENRAREVISQGIRLEKKMSIKVVALASIVSDFPRVPEVVSIDTEGNDFELIFCLLDLGIRPKVICIEDFQVAKTSRIYEKIINSGYSRVAEIYPSSIYSLK